MSTSLVSNARRQTALGLGVVLIAAGAFLLSPLAGAFGGGDPPAAPPAVPGAVGGTGASPTLSAAERTRALEIATSHPVVSGLIADGQKSTLVVPWTTLHGDRLLGAGLEIRWAEPKIVVGTWPAIYYDETEQLSPPFVATRASVEATNVSGVHVSVDFASGKVVRIEPLPGANVARYQPEAAARRALPPQPMTPR